MKIKMSNNDFVELSCDIADMIIAEKFGYGYRKMVLMPQMKYRIILTGGMIVFRKN